MRELRSALVLGGAGFLGRLQHHEHVTRCRPGRQQVRGDDRSLDDAFVRLVGARVDPTGHLAWLTS